jgi:hypothetical protein
MLWQMTEIDGQRVLPPDIGLSRRHRPLHLAQVSVHGILVVHTQCEVGHDRIYGLDASTGKVVWERGPALSTHPRDPGGKWFCAWEALWERAPHHEDLLLVGWRQGSYYPSAIEFCRTDGSVLSRYYHPGHVFPWAQADGDGDGTDEYLFFGANNPSRSTLPTFTAEMIDQQMCSAVLLVANGPLAGQAYPWNEWQGIDPAAEAAYLLIPPYTAGRRSDIRDISCDEQMRLIVTGSDERRLHLSPGLAPEQFDLAPWSQEWLAMRNDVRTQPVFRVADGAVDKVDVPINPSE